MANVKITELPESSSITSDDLLVMVDSGNPYVTKKIAWKNIIDNNIVKTTGYSNGQLLIGSGTSLTANTLTSGSGISIVNGSGTITIHQSPVGISDAPSNQIIYGRKDNNWVDITSPANLQIRRGLQSEINSIIPLSGEPVWATDTKILTIGNENDYAGDIINAITYIKPFAKRTDSTNIHDSGQYICLDNIVTNISTFQTYLGMSGNVRGQGAVDLSLSRNNPNCVASGAYSFIGGGQNNLTTGSYAFVGGGNNGQATGSSSASLCDGKAFISNMLAIGAGKATSPSWGDGTYCERFILSVAKKTTNATITTLNGSDNNYTLLLSTNMAIFGTAQIVAIQETTGVGVAHFCRKFAAQRLNTSTTTSLDFSTVGTDYNPNSYAVTASTASNGIYAIRVTGAADTTLRWVCSIDGIIISIT